MRVARRVVPGVIVAIAAVAGVTWLGLRVRPKPFAAYAAAPSPLDMVEIPTGLPEAVERFARASMGKDVPQIHSAVLSGRGWIRVGGIKFPARWRFTYQAGEGYRHYIEATVFGQPVMKVNEYYLDGHGRMELPFGVIEGEPKVDLAANLGLWAETVWMPAVWFTDPRVTWEEIDDRTARLIVPFGAVTREKPEVFTVWFDPDTGLLRRMVTLRYRDTEPERQVWINEVHGWMEAGGMRIPSHVTVTWEDQGQPWISLEVEEAVYNVDVDEYIRAKGL